MSKYINVFEKYTTTCPLCGEETFYVAEFTYKTPFFDEILVISGKCIKCGYRFFDTYNIKSHKPVRFILKVKEITDLNSLVIKSQTAIITIPELGISIEPGIASSPYITTIEGILYRVLETLEAYQEENRETYEKTREIIKDAIEGKIAFTFILEDAFGNSLIIPKRKEALEIVRLEGNQESKKNDNYRKYGS